ncbi:MAG: hypothetical protein P9L94_05230 [Candidatus Hinthialibacter antarcticus]|nr:hypothetical protein [Candidatus Hinthialibacter antarcticus]
MSGKRFLRDNTLGSMLDEIKTISNKVSQNEFPNIMFSQSLASLSELYETNTHVLERIENAIEGIRSGKENSEVLEDLVHAAAHVQIGLVTVHKSLKTDVSAMLHTLNHLKEVVSLDEDES